jgi:O-antigen/teichoic acid export membrane protein
VDVNTLPTDSASVEDLGDTSPESLREATLDGVRWVSIAQGLAQFVALAAGIALARLVSPAQFGRLAVAVIVNEMALALAAEGLGNALVQRKVLTRAHLEGGMFLGLAIGLGLMLMTIGLVPFITTPLFGAQTTRLFQLFAPVFALAGARIVPLAILQRRLDFRRTSLIELTGSLTAAVLSVALAIAGLEAKSYVFGEIASGIVTLVMLVAVTPLTLPRWRVREARELLSFGIPAALAGFTWVAQRNADYAILGIRVPPVVVGYYYRAYTLGVENERRISTIISRLALPLYSRTNDVEQMRALRARIVRANATIIIPALALFIVLAPTIVPILFGSHWNNAILPARILAGAGMAITLNNANSALLLAAGRPHVLSAFNLCQLLAYAAVIWFTAPFGLTVVCSGVVAFQIAVTIVYAIVLHRVVGVPLFQLVSDAGPALVSSLALVLVCLPIASRLSAAHVPALITMIVVSLIATGVCVLILRAGFASTWADVRLIAARITRSERLSGLTRKLRSAASVS